jgi:hypothetical protein
MYCVLFYFLLLYSTLLKYAVFPPLFLATFYSSCPFNFPYHDHSHVFHSFFILHFSFSSFILFSSSSPLIPLFLLYSSSSLLTPLHLLHILQAVAFENKVAPETENIFGDPFFESLDIVCAALDNVEVRQSLLCYVMLCYDHSHSVF